MRLPTNDCWLLCVNIEGGPRLLLTLITFSQVFAFQYVNIQYNALGRIS
jgi:hypothetical protein